MILDVCIDHCFFELVEAQTCLCRDVQVVANDTASRQCTNHFVISLSDRGLYSILLGEEMTDERWNLFLVSCILVMHADLSEDELSCFVDFSLIEHQRNVNNNEDNIAVVEVVIGSDFCSHEGPRSINAMHSQWVQCLIPTLIS